MILVRLPTASYYSAWYASADRSWRSGVTGDRRYKPSYASAIRHGDAVADRIVAVAGDQIVLIRIEAERAGQAFGHGTQAAQRIITVAGAIPFASVITLDCLEGHSHSAWHCPTHLASSPAIGGIVGDVMDASVRRSRGCGCPRHRRPSASRCRLHRSHDVRPSPS